MHQKSTDVLLENGLLVSVVPPDFWNQLQGFCSRSASTVVRSNMDLAPVRPKQALKGRLAAVSLHRTSLNKVTKEESKADRNNTNETKTTEELVG